MSAHRLVVLFGTPGRGGFNEAGLAGVQAAQRRGVAADVVWIESTDPVTRTQHLRALCDAGPALIVAHGGQGDVPVGAVAPDYPHIQFAVTQGHRPAHNVAVYEVLQEQSAFLAGILAGGRAAPDGVVGHLSGEPVRPGLSARAAYADGVRQSTGPPTLLTGFCGQQHDADLAERWALALAHAGAQCVFVMLDGGRDGVTRACRKAGIWQIGNVLDWVARDPAVYLASAIADSGRAVSQALLDHHAGQLAVGSAWRIGLETEDAVRLVLGDDVSAVERATVHGWAQRLIRGEIVPRSTYAGSAFAPGLASGS